MINFVVDILLPPAGLAVLALILALLPGRAARVGSLVALIGLVALGVPAVSMALLDGLSPPAAPAEADASKPGAIVILSADAVRLDGDGLDPGMLTLDRVRAGAALARRTDLPVLVSGGPITGSSTTLAGMMRASLVDDFRVPVRWTEDRSLDTWENARFSAEILSAAGIRRVYLVTHDWHMRRALIAFRHFGLDPVPVPVRPAYAPPFTWRALVVGTTAWFNSYIAVHEWVGLAYYAIRP